MFICDRELFVLPQVELESSEHACKVEPGRILPESPAPTQVGRTKTKKLSRKATRCSVNLADNSHESLVRHKTPFRPAEIVAQMS